MGPRFPVNPGFWHWPHPFAVSARHLEQPSTSVSPQILVTGLALTPALALPFATALGLAFATAFSGLAPFSGLPLGSVFRDRLGSCKTARVCLMVALRLTGSSAGLCSVRSAIAGTLLEAKPQPNSCDWLWGCPAGAGSRADWAEPSVPGAEPSVPGTEPSVPGAEPSVPGTELPIPGTEPSVPGKVLRLCPLGNKVSAISPGA